jgi:anti-sigma regulatory factor (Ser/Thr protein kinase)
MSVTVPFEATMHSSPGSVPVPAQTGYDTWATLGRGGGDRTDTWTRALQLPADARAASEARAHVRRSMASWELAADGDVADVATLLTSELVTNALTHGESPVTVAVSVSGGTLRVEVHDRSRILPAPWPVIGSVDAETGRGLLLVEKLATDWGFYRTPGGKAVYFILAS